MGLFLQAYNWTGENICFKVRQQQLEQASPHSEYTAMFLQTCDRAGKTICWVKRRRPQHSFNTTASLRTIVLPSGAALHHLAWAKECSRPASSDQAMLYIKPPSACCGHTAFASILLLLLAGDGQRAASHEACSARPADGVQGTLQRSQRARGQGSYGERCRAGRQVFGYDPSWQFANGKARMHAEFWTLLQWQQWCSTG
jgi:hypothetical protein